MSLFYAASTGGFYDSAINKVIPGDAVAVTDEAHAALLAAQAAGATIQADANGNPMAVEPPAPTLAQTQATLCAQIDATADAVYAAIGGPSPGRLAEYQQANTDAVAFKAAGYAGAVPSTVGCWTQANAGWTNQQAADDIIATAAKWTAALQGIRSARLLGKAAVNAAATIADAQTAATTAIANVEAAGEAA